LLRREAGRGWRVGGEKETEWLRQENGGRFFCAVDRRIGHPLGGRAGLWEGGQGRAARFGLRIASEGARDPLDRSRLTWWRRSGTDGSRGSAADHVVLDTGWSRESEAGEAAAADVPLIADRLLASVSFLTHHPVAG